MAYATKVKIGARLPKFKAQIDDGTIDVSEHIARADADVDGMLAGLYQTPINPAPAMLVELANDIAAYKTALAYLTVINSEENSNLYRLYGDANKKLERMASGEIKLPGVVRITTAVDAPQLAGEFYAGSINDYLPDVEGLATDYTGLSDRRRQRGS